MDDDAWEARVACSVVIIAAAAAALDDSDSSSSDDSSDAHDERLAALTRKRDVLVARATSTRGERSWRGADALGAALVMLRRARGGRDVLGVLLGFLERPSPPRVSRNRKYGRRFCDEKLLEANIRRDICWSCRRDLHPGGFSLGLIESDDYMYHLDDEYALEAREEEVLQAHLCPRDERSEDCLAGYRDLMPAFVRASRLWRERDVARRREEIGHYGEADVRFLRAAADGHDFFDVIAAHPPFLSALQEVGWYPHEDDSRGREWRCDCDLPTELG